MQLVCFEKVSNLQRFVIFQFQEAVQQDQQNQANQVSIDHGYLYKLICYHLRAFKRMASVILKNKISMH